MQNLGCSCLGIQGLYSRYSFFFKSQDKCCINIAKSQTCMWGIYFYLDARVWYIVKRTLIITVACVLYKYIGSCFGPLTHIINCTLQWFHYAAITSGWSGLSVGCYFIARNYHGLVICVLFKVSSFRYLWFSIVLRRILNRRCCVFRKYHKIISFLMRVFQMRSISPVRSVLSLHIVRS